MTRIIIDLNGAVKMLGEENESAIECLWGENEWDEQVELGVFVRAWTKYVVRATQTAEWLKRNGLL